jgi:hypothetical protein
MNTLNIQLDGDAIREATVQAIIGVLTPDVKEKILRQSVDNLLKPSTNSWDNKKSLIELAFEQAINKIARDEAIKMIEEDEITREKVKNLLRKSADIVLGITPEDFASKLAEAFLSSIREYNR